MEPGQTPARQPADGAGENEAQRSARRVQVAAVAAQQMALFEEEARLQEERGALMQQQEQLAAHLEEKRQLVQQGADQAQATRATLKRERQEHAAAAAKQNEELARGGKELEEGRAKLAAARQRLRLLRRRLKRHFQRRWAVADQQLRHREAAVNDQHRRFEKEAEKLHDERQALARARLSCNGDVELGKRQLRAEWQELRHEQQRHKEALQIQQADLAAQSQSLRQREQAVADAERRCAEGQSAWEQKRQVAEQELQGLESRILNQRQKLLERQRELAETEAPLGGPTTAAGTAAVASSENGAEPATPCVLAAEEELRQRAAELDRLAENFADQRLELVEQWQHLAAAQLEWEKARDAAADSLQAMTAGWPQKEQTLLARQAALEAAETDLCQRRQELAQCRQQLEAWAGKLKLREAAWEGQRERLLAAIRSREETATKQLAAVSDLRQRWAKRRRQELDGLQTAHAAAEQLRQEYAGLRQECWKRALSLDQQQREVAEKTLALEEYRQRFVLRSPDAAAVENRLERIRQRWLKHNAGVMRDTQQQLQHLQTEFTQWERRGQALLEVARELTDREAALAECQVALDEQDARAETEKLTLRQQLQSAKVQQALFERHIAGLKEEIERLAQVLLEAADEPAAIVAKAA